MDVMKFQKWQGAGNDFIVLDNRNHQADGLDSQKINKLCDRHFGIGADGLILMSEPDAGYDFNMLFFNPDGFPAEMCGNGGRCITAMAYELGMIGKEARFLTTDGVHEARVIRPDWIRLKMKEVEKVERVEPGVLQGVFLNTGVPHLVMFVDSIEGIDVEQVGRKYRYDARFAPGGTNVNFVQVLGNNLKVRTYERGVERETLACGTGNIAAAIATEWLFKAGYSVYNCHAAGGDLTVTFQQLPSGHFTDVWLEGPATRVFEGSFPY